MPLISTLTFAALLVAGAADAAPTPRFDTHATPPTGVTLVARRLRLTCEDRCDNGQAACEKASDKCRHQICTDEELQAESDARGQCASDHNECLMSCAAARNQQ